jgi:hypothetical protein
MIIYQNIPKINPKNNNTQNESNYFQLSYSSMNNQSRNLNNNNNKENRNKKYSLYSTKEATPRKEYSKVIKSTTIKNSFNNQINKKNNKNKNELDDSLSQITPLLNKNKKNLNFSDLVGKIPGIDDEPNFVCDQILFYKSRIKKAKILTNKIGTLKLPLSNISSKEALTKSDIGIKCFSDRSQINGNLNTNKNNNDDVGVSCCIFGKKT